MSVIIAALLLASAITLPSAEAKSLLTTILVLDPDGTLVSPSSVSATIGMDGSLLITGKSPIATGWLLMSASWINSSVSSPAFNSTPFKLVSLRSGYWYATPLSSDHFSVQVLSFVPRVGVKAYTYGSPDSVSLERPMFVSVVQFPHVAEAIRTGLSANGTFVHKISTPDMRLVLNFTSENHSGQRILFSDRWLRSLGVTDPRFSYEDNVPIPSANVTGGYEIHPDHFSFIYVFQRDEFFRIETAYPPSLINWDSSNQRISVVNYREAPGDELFTKRLPRELDATTSFTLSSRWKATTQGNWQLVVPLFITSSNNFANVASANSIYFYYASRDSILGQSPFYYLRYADSSGSLRIDKTYTGAVNTEYHFSVSYNAGTKVLTLAIKNSSDVTLLSGTYTIGSNANDGFGFGKLGASTKHTETSSEPPTIGWVDDVSMDFGIVPNQSVETDSNSDNIPDGWHTVWYFASRVSTDSHSGRYAIKIADTSGGDGGGMQTNNIAATAGVNYEATVYVKVSPGASSGFSFSIYFYNSGGATIGAAGTTITSTNNIWRRLFLDATSPAGTVYLQVAVWSTNENIGTAYFDDLSVSGGRNPNAGFDIDNDGNGIPDSWTLTGSATRSSARAYSGSYSAKIGSSFGEISTNFAPAYPGVMYAATVYAFVESGTWELRLNFADQNQNVVMWPFIQFGVTSGVWIRMKVGQVAPSNTRYVGIYLTYTLGGVAYFDDASVQPDLMPLHFENNLWAVTLHPGEDTENDMSNLPNAVAWALDLGVGAFRTGSQWSTWKSGQYANFNYDVVSSERRIINAATAKGIDIIEIVGGDRQWWCGENSWPGTLYQSDSATFFNELESLASVEASNLGSDVHYYLMWNEANHPCDLVSSGWDFYTFARIYSGLYTGEGVYGSIPRNRWFETIVNAFADWPDWDTALDGWLVSDAGWIDIAAIDHYPSTWTNEGINPIGSDWGRLDTLIGILNNRHVRGAIMELGFSTCENVGIYHNEIRQQTWVNNALPIIKTKVNAQYANYNSRIVLLDWYTMRDKGSPFPSCDPYVSLVWGQLDYGTENNFGIVRKTNVLKIGYPDLRTQISSFAYA